MGAQSIPKIYGLQGVFRPQRVIISLLPHWKEINKAPPPPGQISCTPLQSSAHQVYTDQVHLKDDF